MGTFRTTRGLHNKSLGCGASGAYALGPDGKKKKEEEVANNLIVNITKSVSPCGSVGKETGY